MVIKKLLIANRGEIAVRIIRAAKELGLQTVMVHSTVDANSLAVEMADETVEIGPASAAKSYLNVEAVLNAAKKTGADGVHPGYGFLAENADFADAVEAAGMIFVGPTGAMIRKMGDKASARKAAENAGVPTVPGSDGIINDMKAAQIVAMDIGYPVMIKATAGGGGRGIRIAENAEEFASLAKLASEEAKLAFGDGGLYLEKLIDAARHIEVQVMGDGIKFVHCYERECSLQRRRQKVWEEAPSSSLSDTVREKLCSSAVALAKSVGYRGAGTVEFLYDDKTGNYYFIEMNTRIQVEHTITEEITGIDLVAEMICIAGGEPLSFRQEDIAIQGHAIEVRINAEDPTNKFMPSPGVIGKMRIPGGPGVRIDHMLFEGYKIPTAYDSLIGKLIVHAGTREAAISRLKRAVSELRVNGIKTSAPLFLALAENENIRQGEIHTKWLETWLESNSDKIRPIADIE